MAYEHREGQGSLFKNDKKNERQPDFKGTIMIKGTLYNISAWSRTAQNGREYISLQAEEKTEDGNQPRPHSASQRNYQFQQPAFQAPTSVPEPAAPAPTYDDLPAFGDDNEDLPF